jgi:hypothetical protein
VPLTESLFCPDADVVVVVAPAAGEAFALEKAEI